MGVLGYDTEAYRVPIACIMALLSHTGMRRKRGDEVRMWLTKCVCATTLLAIASVAIGQTTGNVDSAGNRTDRLQSRHWRVIVLIPEKHLSQPRVPDPAAETAVRKELIEAGYKVIDQERVNALRDQAVIDRIFQQGKDTRQEVVKLGQRFGADVLVIGEAFTQQDGVPRQIATDLGTVTRLQCRGRLELRAYRTDSAEIIFSDSQHLTGSPDATVELASKACLSELGETVGGLLLKKLAGLSASRTQQIELVLRKVASASVALELERTIGKMAGVKEIGPGEYTAHSDTFEITIDKEAIPAFVTSLELAPGLKRFHLTILSKSASRIVLESR